MKSQEEPLLLTNKNKYSKPNENNLGHHKRFRNRGIEWRGK